MSHHTHSEDVYEVMDVLPETAVGFAFDSNHVQILNELATDDEAFMLYQRPGEAYVVKLMAVGEASGPA